MEISVVKVNEVFQTISFPCAKEMENVSDIVNEEIRKRQEEQERIEKERIEALKQNGLDYFLLLIKANAEKGHYSLPTFNWTKTGSPECAYSPKDCIIILEAIRPILEALGYVVNTKYYEYSKAWQDRSGKLGYIYSPISWRIE